MIEPFSRIACRPLFIHITLGILFLPTCGCSSDQGVEVSGSVSLNGDPLSGGKVTFYHPTKPGRNVTGYIQPDGTYRVHFVPRGSVKASVVVLPPKIKAAGSAKASRDVPKVPDVPLKYSDPATSDLVFQIRSAKEDLNIELQK